MNIPWRLLFGIDVVLNLAGILLDQPMLIQISKPLLMPLLAGWFMSQNAGVGGVYRWAIVLALAFSTLGDILLMFEGSLFFISGLAAFLIAHICYIIAFGRIASFKSGFLVQQPWVTIPLLAYPLLLLWYLWHGIPASMKIPVCLYASVITIMALSVLNLRGKLAATHFTTMMAGAMLFVLSDSLIAVSKFGESFAGVRPAIMLTYIAGQYLLIQSAIIWLHKSEKASRNR